MSAAGGAGRAGPVRRTLRGRHVSLVFSPRMLAVTLALMCASIALAAYMMTVGRLAVPIGEVLAILFGGGDGGMVEQVIVNVRLPRVLTAAFVGAALAVSGAVFQSISRNALGSPDVIGFTMGAATGALVQIVFLGGGPAAVAFSAVAGGMATAFAVYLLSLKDGAGGGYRLILVGIGAGATLSALNTLMLVKGDLDNAITANLWLAGSLTARSWQHAIPVMAGCAILIPVVALNAHKLSVMEMGDDVARQLGVDVERCRLVMIFCAVALSALATAAAGPIAFVALAAPQLVARLAGARGVPVISAAAMGACLLLAADLISQNAPFGLVAPIGRMTGFVGGLYLLWLLMRRQR